MTRADWDVVVVGGANTDYLVRASKLPVPGQTVQGDEFQEAPGGKGANQAVAVARLGGKVTFVARLGSEERAKTIAHHLNVEGVDTRFMTYDSSAPTGVALIMVDHEGRKQILAAPGANTQLTAADVHHAAPAIRAAKVVLAQLEVPVEAVRAAFQLGKNSGARVVLDPAPAIPLEDDLLQLIDVIRPNADEAQVLTGITIEDRKSAREAAEQLLTRGVGAVAVQASHEGDLLVWRGGEHWLPRLPVKSLDATGAGDAFAAAFAMLLSEGRSLAEAGCFANAAAALATAVVGAQAGLPRRDAVLELLASPSGG